MNSCIPLQDYLDMPGKSQKAVAEAIGMAQGSVSLMVKEGRKVFISDLGDGNIEAHEWVKLPLRRHTNC